MQPFLSRLAVPSLVFVVCTSFTAAEEPTVDELRIQQLIEQLDDDRYSRRTAATKQLMELGLDAVPHLKRILKTGSAETRTRARQIIYFTVTAKIRNDLVTLSRVKQDAQFDVEQGMWLVARIVDPRVKKKDLSRQLDALADRVRKRVAEQHGAETKPKSLPPAEAVAALRHVLFTEEKLTGNVDDYDNPVNSSLSHVLKTRKGLPILLSHVVISVADRLEIPMVGLGLPGRYMCMYDGSRAPGGRAESIIIDPFGGGRVLTRQRLSEVIPGFNPRSSLTHYGNRNAVSRMLINLSNDYYAVGDERMAEQVDEFRGLLYRRSDAP